MTCSSIALIAFCAQGSHLIAVILSNSLSFLLRNFPGVLSLSKTHKLLSLSKQPVTCLFTRQNTIATVFRRVNEQMTGRVGRDSGLWVFDEESTPGKFLKRNEREFNKITAIGRRPDARKAMGAIAKRVIRVLEENAREVRKTKKKQIGRKQA